ncbi:MarR family winged helix-turn-helix transcriptional regulator [Priestia koreensis]|uniref:MarR family winged helix-turn-helix transcriptional regulator n=1 Tax=Priestia koreensis TaxID=284581 RepID=UPI001F574E1A|nr:MarR family transcriptional regulator [Priestia koreensis]MCM3004953.1 MarR family transcriptional regulator [Priestia koreensis]UNL82953.1 MarR family transcriptional regulator [Priestia koreensis]
MEKEQLMIDLWRQLLRVNREFKQALQHMNEHTAISNSGIGIIFKLENEEKMKMNEIADYLGITLGSATSMIDKLEKHDIVERTRSKEDRRIVSVQLTERGREVLEKIRQYFTDEAKTIFHSLPEDQIANMLGTVEQISNYLNDYNQSNNAKK